MTQGKSDERRRHSLFPDPRGSRQPPAPDSQPDFADELWLEVTDTLRNRSDTPTAPNLIVVGIDDAPGRRTALAGRTAIWVATAAVAAAIAAVAWFGNIGSNTIDGTASETLTIPSEAWARYVTGVNTLDDLIEQGSVTLEDFDRSVEAVALRSSDLTTSGLYEASELGVFDQALGQCKGGHDGFACAGGRGDEVAGVAFVVLYL